MGKTEINNEIVLLRHAVRQARVCVINKLIRVAKLLRDSNGSEAQKEKNQRKADKLVAEVYALKTIKDDEISKFGILNDKDVKDIIQNQSSSSSDRVIARVVGYKSFNRRLTQFRDKFPDYRTYFSEEKKKKAKSKKKKSRAKSIKPLVEDKSHSHREDLKELGANSDKISENSAQHNSDSETIDKTKNNSRKRKKPLKEDVTDSVNKKLSKPTEDNTLKDTNKQVTPVELCSVTKEATVKRFTDLLEEQDSGDAQPSTGSAKHATNVQQTKPVDDFFMTGNNEEGIQENLTEASTSYIKFDTFSRTLRSSHQVKTENLRSTNLHKNNIRKVKESKTSNYDQSRNHTKGKKFTNHNKYSDKQSSATRQEKRTSDRVSKSTNKNNLNNVGDKQKAANLHPSWLAKKKQQEVMKQGFQGKKIVFAND